LCSRSIGQSEGTNIRYPSLKWLSKARALQPVVSKIDLMDESIRTPDIEDTTFDFILASYQQRALQRNRHTSLNLIPRRRQVVIGNLRRSGGSGLHLAGRDVRLTESQDQRPAALPHQGKHLSKRRKGRIVGDAKSSCTQTFPREHIDEGITE
jgi:hypothetical protein